VARPTRHPRYTEGYIDRHGKPRFYLRRPGAKRVPLPGLPWSPEFMGAYQAALDGVTPAARPITIAAARASAGSTAEVVARYLLDASFTTLAASTREKRRRFLDGFRETYGRLPFAKLDTPSVAALLGKLTAHNQRDWLKTLRGLVRFAMALGYIGADVTLGLKAARAKVTGGYRTWQDDHIETYRAHWPRGTAQRLALELMVGMAGRRGDVVKLGWQHIRNGTNGPEIWYRQNKTGNAVEGVPLTDELRAAVEATPRDRLTFLLGAQGEPYRAKRFGTAFSAWAREAGVPAGLSAHGLRKSCCRILAEMGCTAPEIMSVSGHRSLAEVQRYIDAANRRTMAAAAAEKRRKA
jgi:integrase